MKRSLAILALTLISLSLIASPVLAIANPTSGPTIERVDIYRHCLETWDMLVVVQYHLDYTTNPDETINQAYLGRFMSATDTELANVAPYAYYDKGYDHGIFSMYLDASYTAHWETACSMRFEGNPTLDWQALTASSAMLGAVADDGGTRTDETTAANNDTTDDMTLLPTAPAVNDAYYFGDDKPFDKVTVNISTQGDGVWSIIWEYWNGDEWSGLSGVADYTAHFRAAPGNRNAEYTLPADWEECEVKAINAYWIRARVFAYTSVVIAPKGEQSWTNVADAPPITTTTTLNWHTLATIEATEPLLGASIISIANSLSDYWSVALTEETAAGTRLSTYGEQYFTNAIPNLRTMTPAIFAGAVESPVYEPETYEQSGRDLYLSRLDGTTIGIGMQGLSDWTTIPLTVVKAILWFILIGIIAYIIAIKVRDLRIALFSVLVLIPCGTLVGMLSSTFTVIAALLCGVALAYSLFYQRASG